MSVVFTGKPEITWKNRNIEDGLTTHIYRSMTPIDIYNLPEIYDTVSDGNVYRDESVEYYSGYYYAVAVTDGTTLAVSPETLFFFVGKPLTAPLNIQSQYSDSGDNTVLSPAIHIESNFYDCPYIK